MQKTQSGGLFLTRIRREYNSSAELYYNAYIRRSTEYDIRKEHYCSR